MKLPRRQFLRLTAGAAALPLVSRTAGAQTYPSRPIMLVVPAAPGGVMDLIGRMLAERMKNSLGQPVIVENVSGGGMTIGVGRVARAAPDGYALGLGNNGSHVATGAMRFSMTCSMISSRLPCFQLVRSCWSLKRRCR